MSDQLPQIDPVLTRFRATLNEIYGPRPERVMLYGSRARGDAREDSVSEPNLWPCRAVYHRGDGEENTLFITSSKGKKMRFRRRSAAT
jgi:hypothetical protein